MSDASDPVPIDGPPPMTPDDLQVARWCGRGFRLLQTLPDPAFDVIVSRSQRPSFPPRRTVDRSLVTRERLGSAGREHPGVPVTWIDRPRASRAAVIHLHGGAYTLGESRFHWRWLEELRRRSGVAAAMVQYRMPPTSPFPAALDDAVAAITELVDRAVVREGTWVLSGDSAGGGLALAVLERLRHDPNAMPAGVLLTSPWTDLTLSDPLVRENEKRDVVLTPAMLERSARMYAGRYALDDPRVSPRFGDVSHLPPMLLFGAEDDILLGDARNLAARLEREDMPVVSVEQPGGPHDYPILTDGPAAQWALRRQIAFVRRACGLRG